MGNQRSTLASIAGTFDIKPDTPIVVTDPRYVLPKPVSLSIPTGRSRIFISDASTKGQYFSCKSRFAHNSCFRKLCDATNTCILSSHPQDVYGKTYKFFAGEDANAPYVAEAKIDELVFSHILIKCYIQTPARNYMIVLQGNWRTKDASIYFIPPKLQEFDLNEEIMSLAIPIARTRMGKGKDRYVVDIAPGVDIAVITALCITLDGRILATSGQNQYVVA
ncbi:hypothetical protein BZG36_02458 [Bifiguratus adelaidae]|uniref:Uncharacterized protein n=1 Tax=Bifiguratus adelaidae TaxID=1938954 RepID=A0A261Y3L5_9FUNG|nr:hypothetical protein BZG36_02458 [Bifiguratus adelaidae]